MRVRARLVGLNYLNRDVRLTAPRWTARQINLCRVQSGRTMIRGIDLTSGLEVSIVIQCLFPISSIEKNHSGIYKSIYYWCC